MPASSKSLSKGKPVLVSQIEKRPLQIAASLEQNSEHPLARGIVEKARSRKIRLLKVTKFLAHSGAGVEGVINGKRYFLGRTKYGPVTLISGNKLLATFSFADTLKSGD
ncbi:hypothetical protein COS54_00045 [Candidatus Shapirobacteria bacterium CG03_land_8_20_14_0_80_39_12]|uniref:Heavy metal translocating P-type ATPase n=1 Tax=Candidatus Shapirobacteria bacterium CG03_land_8_20_14_0_80_39_12 TaxID=1974879 RepID=A0A2M7BG36_9BACT|nr:MAG: hypothetical protein COS54_00045 [Candidatus Shapirobacteria bacterium CG03_land_8_20_14_0_80_39_12]